MSKETSAVLIIGAGIGGMKAAFELADAGRKVYLLDRSPAVGGTLTQLDKWFPDNHCGLCKIIPFLGRDLSSQFCLRREFSHPNIDILSYAELLSVSGEVPDFQVTVNLFPRYVDMERCTGCGLCVQECPIEVADEFNEGLVTKKAISLKYPLPFPQLYTIDMTYCTKCGKCVDVCPTNAITLDQTEEQKELAVGTIILSTGFEEFDPTPLTHYGYGRFPNVVTSIEYERMLSSIGPFNGNLVRPSDGKTPEKIAFIQCVGSRDTERDYCSSACCMYSLKEARLTKQAYPSSKPSIYYMDMRAFGKGYHRYYEDAKREGIEFVRCRVPTIRENPLTKNLILFFVDEQGNPQREEFDVAVLSVGQRPHPLMEKTANILGIDRNQWGFCKTSSFEPVDTNKKGIFVCGSIASPKDIHDTIIEAGAAALKSSLIVSEATKDIACEEKKPLDEAEPRVGVFLCECGNEISSTLDIPSIVEYCQGLKDVYSVQSIPYLCLTEGMDAVKEKISQNTINRVVLGACVPYRYERRFKSALKSSEIDPLLVDIVNLREHVSWIHKENGEGAQNKAKALLSTSVEKMRFSEPISSHEDSIKKRALVIGGGITGVISALSIAEAGFEVDLIEKGEGLGGYLRDKRIPLEEGKDPQEFLREVVGKITSHNLATIYTHTFVESLDGYLGNFIATIKPKDSEALCIEYGAVVIATGGLEHLPSTYRYKESDRIVTQGEFEKALFEGDSKVENAQVIVMIQCVESRDEQRPYCSRVCCREAINNALYLKEKNEHASIYILNRDIMSYGFSEEYYTEARKKGIMFAKYDQDTPPEVEISGEKILVTFENIQLGAKNQLEADLLVLSTGIDPGDNSEIAQMLDLELTEDGFFKEVEPKFRPLEMLREGIYVGGLSHSPVNLSESITQGFASAQRVIALLSKKELHPGSIVARVTERKCAGCELCIAACPYSARVKDRKKGVVIVREALCQGCGSCAMVCPNSATKLVGFMDKQVVNILDNLLI